MEIILAPSCESLTGSFNRKDGYYIRAKKINGKTRFFTQRKPRKVKADEHIKYILRMAEMSNGWVIHDIVVDWKELESALYKANKKKASRQIIDKAFELNKTTYNAKDLLNLKDTLQG